MSCDELWPRNLARFINTTWDLCSGEQIVLFSLGGKSRSVRQMQKGEKENKCGWVIVLFMPCQAPDTLVLNV